MDSVWFVYDDGALFGVALWCPGVLWACQVLHMFWVGLFCSHSMGRRLALRLFSDFSLRVLFAGNYLY